MRVSDQWQGISIQDYIPPRCGEPLNGDRHAPKDPRTLAARESIYVNCGHPMCCKSTKLDIRALIDRLGRDHGSMHDDPVGLFVCSACKAADRDRRPVFFTCIPDYEGQQRARNFRTRGLKVASARWRQQPLRKGDLRLSRRKWSDYANRASQLSDHPARFPMGLQAASDRVPPATSFFLRAVCRDFP
ncbi:hypothetical protein [Mesorhizobium sp.]|uniref:hypothetical protein n=1 Tax=Mesorhizobium sp. TaxID=1871066 RepID=UPI002580FA94|nr:hypothetical protein [Mesorhizobium sp.]